MTIIWCMVPETGSVTERIFCHFGPLFALLPPKNQKIKILKKWKKSPGDIIILHKCTKNHDHMLYCSWDMVCDRCNCYFSFWTIFCPFVPLTSPKKENFKKKQKKMNKNTWRHHHFTEVYVQKIMIMWYMVWDMVCDGCNRCFSF